MFNQFNPDLVFYLGGIDPLGDDHLGRLSLSLKGLEMRDRLVIKKVTACDIPLVLLMSGGYSPTLYDTVYAHSLMYKAAMEIAG